jgi:hypothetical protein
MMMHGLAIFKSYNFLYYVADVTFRHAGIQQGGVNVGHLGTAKTKI